MSRSAAGFVRCESCYFTTQFIWKVAFNTEKLPTGATCMSRRFHIQPLTDIEFWFHVSKDCDAGSISFYCYKNNRYPLAQTTAERRIEIQISIDEFHMMSRTQIMKDEMCGVRFAFSLADVNRLRQKFSPVWKILWKFTFQNFEQFKPEWHPISSVHLNEETDKGFPFWNVDRFRRNGEFSDLILEVASREYKVHKCILAYRSNISKELLKNDKIVLKSKHISDVEMNFVLSYMYTGSIENLGNLHVLRIYNVARELDIPTLTEACSKIIVKAFNPKTILDVVKFVEPYVDQFLLMEITVFVLVNFSEISKTEKWLEFKRTSKLAAYFEQADRYYEYAKDDLHVASID